MTRLITAAAVAALALTACRDNAQSNARPGETTRTGETPQQQQQQQQGSGQLSPDERPEGQVEQADPHTTGATGGSGGRAVDPGLRTSPEPKVRDQPAEMGTDGGPR